MRMHCLTPDPPRARLKPQIPSICDWAQAALGFTPDAQQARALDLTHRRIAVNCSRQWGKSTTAAVRALDRKSVV